MTSQFTESREVSKIHIYRAQRPLLSLTRTKFVSHKISRGVFVGADERHASWRWFEERESPVQELIKHRYAGIPGIIEMLKNGIGIGISVCKKLHKWLIYGYQELFTVLVIFKAVSAFDKMVTANQSQLLRFYRNYICVPLWYSYVIIIYVYIYGIPML